MAAQDEIFLTCSFCSALASFCRLAVRVPSSVSAFCSRSRKEFGPGYHPLHVVLDVPQAVLQVGVHHVLFESPLQLLHHPRQGMDGALELDDFPGQFIDAPGHCGVAGEQLVFDLVDVVFQPRHHGCVVVHHLVQQGVEHGFGAVAQEVGPRLQAAPDLPHAGHLGVPDGDHEVLAGEDVQLTELHGLGFVEVPGGPEHGEQVVAVAFQLGPLVGRNGVLNGELVKAELRRDGGHFRFGGPVEPDPGHAAMLR